MVQGTVASRFYRWRKAGLWARLLAAVQQQADAAEHLDWDIHYVDGTIVRAHQHAAGAHSGSAEAEALGRSQGGFSTKVHIRAEGGGKLMTLVLTPGQRHETVAFEALMAGGAVKRVGGGRPNADLGVWWGIKPTVVGRFGNTCDATVSGSPSRGSRMKIAPVPLIGPSTVSASGSNG